jgi:ribosomal protein L40E
MSAAIGLVMIAGAGGAAAAEPQYVGAKKCRTCHRKELIGDQYGKWEKGAHAKAFETLKSEEAVKFAKKAGITGPPDEAKECVKCHATAFGLKPAQLWRGRPLEVSDGIQCESCHGPGSEYKRKKTMADRKKALAAGMWEPGKDEKICTACHNDESPTWDPAKGFDYEKAKEKIAHPIPKDVKGRYLEVEKERREEMEGR